MTPFSALLLAGTVLLGCGTGLSLHPLLLTAADLAGRLRGLRLQRGLRRQLVRLGLVRDHAGRDVLDWKGSAAATAALIAAASARDGLLSLLALLLGAGALFWLRLQEGQDELVRLERDAGSAVMQLRSKLGSDPSFSRALAGLSLPQGRLQAALAEVASRMRLQQPPAQAVQVLRALPGELPPRLAALLAAGPHLAPLARDELLQALEAEAYRRTALRARARQALGLVRGTIRILQGAAAASGLFLLLQPAWRAFYIERAGNHALLVFLVLAAAGASLFFEVEVRRLGRGEG